MPILSIIMQILRFLCTRIFLYGPFAQARGETQSSPFHAEYFYRAAAGKKAALLEKAMGEWIEGLTPEKVDRRLKRYGPNRLSSQEKESPWLLFWRTCLNPIVLLLAIIGIILFITGDNLGALMVIVMTGFSVFLTFTQEMRSSKAIEGLAQMVKTTASVLRRVPVAGEDGTAKHFTSVRLEVPIQDIVPGDIVFLSAGDLVPGDVRLLTARDLFLNQSAMTGEAMPVEKDAVEEAAPKEVALLNLRNVCFMGSHVVSGRATGVVLRTGRASYFGSLAAAVAKQHVTTRFERDVQSFTWLLIRLMLIIVPLVFVLNGVLKGNWLEAFLFATTVAVGLTPEMLPMILTVNLAKGAVAMARKKVIIKHLYAIQNFGAIDILCTDKTGTLTQDKVILEHHLDLSGQEDEKVLAYTFINSSYQTGLKNLLDIAVLQYVEGPQASALEGRYKKIDEIPFDFQRRRMSVVVADMQAAEKHMLIAKGAPEGILEACAFVEEGGVIAPLTPRRLSDLNQMISDFNEDGLRVIAVAYKLFEPRVSYAIGDEKDMVLLGLVSFLDPPKESAGEALSLLNQKGVHVKILTGDNEIVASKIARHVGLGTQTLSGLEVDHLSDEALLARIDTIDIFARLSPLQKERLVRLFRQKGHVVGFMGDGINDAPALRAADVGISVDNAVDIAKESADVILLEKSLLALEEGVLEGRRVFGNILKYTRMSSSGNFGNILSVTLASILLPFLPILPLQILLLNMLYDLSQATIPLDNVDQEYIDRPRQWCMKDTKRFMFWMGPVSSIFDIATFGFLWFGIHAYADPALFQTGWFIESLLSQVLIVHIIRTRRLPFLESTASLPLVASTLFVALVGVILPMSPFGLLFGFVPMPKVYFLGLCGILVLYGMLSHGVKTWLLRHMDK